MASHPLFLFLWNPNAFAHRIADFNRQFSVVTSMAELRNIKLNTFAGVVVLAELLWRRRKHAGFFGIETSGIFLRLQRQLRQPIIICSFAPLRRICRSNQRELLEILINSAGHTFLHLPFNLRELTAKLEGALDDERQRRLILHISNTEYALRLLFQLVGTSGHPGKMFSNVDSISGILSRYRAKRPIKRDRTDLKDRKWLRKISDEFLLGLKILQLNSQIQRIAGKNKDSLCEIESLFRDFFNVSNHGLKIDNINLDNAIGLLSNFRSVLQDIRMMENRDFWR